METETGGTTAPTGEDLQFARLAAHVAALDAAVTRLQQLLGTLVEGEAAAEPRTVWAAAELPTGHRAAVIDRTGDAWCRGRGGWVRVDLPPSMDMGTLQQQTPGLPALVLAVGVDG